MRKKVVADTPEIDKTPVKEEAISTYSSRKEAQAQASKYGARCYFYSADDVAIFNRIMTSYGVRIKYNPETLHTYFPPINIPPVIEAVRKADEFGFTRLNLTQFYCRPRIVGVNSCHGVTNPNSTNGSNISYINNPWWACYGIYRKSDSKAYLNTGGIASGFRLVEDLQDLPNLVTTVNVMLGYSKEGNPAVFMSRVYGNAKLPEVFTRLVEYFTNVAGLEVFVVHNWSQNDHLQSRKVGVYCYSTVDGNAAKQEVLAPFTESQIKLQYNYPPRRYADIGPMYYKTVGTYPHVAECQQAVLWKHANRQCGWFHSIDKKIYNEILKDIKKCNNMSSGEAPSQATSYPKCTKCNGATAYGRLIEKITNKEVLCETCASKKPVRKRVVKKTEEVKA